MPIYDKLASIQQRLAVPKDRDNNFSGFKYRSAADILAKVKPLLKEYGCALVLSDEIVMIGDRYYIRATAALTDTENPIDTISATAYAREDPAKKGMDGSQITGSASSYARKYALAGLFAIDDEKDADTRSQEENETIQRCSDCGEEITGYKTKDGKAVSAAEWARNASKRYGAALCTRCAKARESAKESAKEGTE